MFLFFLVNNNETPSDAKYDFRGQPHIEMEAAQPHSVTEIAPKSPFLIVNISSIR